MVTYMFCGYITNYVAIVRPSKVNNYVSGSPAWKFFPVITHSDINGYTYTDTGTHSNVNTANLSSFLNGFLNI